MTENEIQEKVLKHLQRYTESFLKKPSFGRNWYFEEHYLIRFGRDRTGYADITLLINGKPFMIVECKRPGVNLTVISKGKEQLESYLNASRANLGIFASHPSPYKWIYYDNSIGFDEIDGSTFWDEIRAAFDTERNIEKEAQRIKLKRIETRTKQLVAEAREDIYARANKIIGEEAKKRVNEKAIRDAVAWQLQQKIKRLESQLQELKSIINNQQTTLDASRNSAMWGWVLFGISVSISVILLIAVAGN